MEFDREELIDFLVSNEEVQTPFTEEDRETLNGFSDEALVDIASKFAVEDYLEEQEIFNETVNNGGMMKKKKKKAAAKMDEGDEEGTCNMSAEDWYDAAPPEVKRIVQNALNFEKSQKEKLVAQIVSNKNNCFTENQLNGMDLDTLQGIASLAGTRASNPFSPNYAGAAGAAHTPTNNTAKDTEPLVVPTMNFDN